MNNDKHLSLNKNDKVNEKQNSINKDEQANGKQHPSKKERKLALNKEDKFTEKDHSINDKQKLDENKISKDRDQQTSLKSNEQVNGKQHSSFKNDSIIISLPNIGISFAFNAKSQLLGEIYLDNLDLLMIHHNQLELRFSFSNRSSQRMIPTFSHAYALFGPTYPVMHLLIRGNFKGKFI